MQYEIEKHNLFVKTDEETAKLFDARWNEKRQSWLIPLTTGALLELYNLTQDEELKKIIVPRTALRMKFHELKNRSDITGNSRLRPYQRVDVSFLKRLPHVAVFNEQRTGKTPTALQLVKEEGADRLIVVCPASLLHNWKKEVETWTHLSAIVYNGTPKQREKKLTEFGSGNALIVSYDTLRGDVGKKELILRAHSAHIIVDEAHILRNHKTARSKAIYTLGKKAKKRLALTGTPSVEHGADVFGILHFLYPERFPSYWGFIDRYFETKDGFFGGKQIGKAKREEELTEILDLISVQRKRKDVMVWLPEKEYQVIEVDLDSKQRTAYKSMLNTFEYEHVDAPSVLAQLTRLRQLCICPEVLKLDVPNTKEKALFEWLENNPNTQVIIFSTFSSYLVKLRERLLKANYEVVMITGSTTAKERKTAVDDFQKRGAHIFLGNIQAAGAGLTLDKAEVCIFLDRDFTPGLNDQAEDRLIPTDESRVHSCTIIDIVAKDTVDQKIGEILRRKVSMSEIVNNYAKIRELLK